MTSSFWIQRSTYLIFSFLLVVWLIVPQNPFKQTIPTPDFLFCLTLAIIFRRPNLLPIALIGLVFLGTDILFNRPIGLWTAIVLIITEFARTQFWRYNDANFITTWLFVSFLILLSTFSHMIVLNVFVISQSDFWHYLIWALLTILIYPMMFCLSFLIVGFDRKNYYGKFMGNRE